MKKMLLMLLTFVMLTSSFSLICAGTDDSNADIREFDKATLDKYMSEALALKNEIINSPSTATWTGTAYYISATGNDSADGLTPETAWKSISKVSDADFLKPGDDLPGAFVKGNVGYICWPVFCDYAENGAYHTKQIVFDMIDALLGESRSLETSLSSNGIATLTKQKDERRYVCHLLYTVTKPRGKVVEVIEDEVPLYDTKVSLRINEKPVRVYLAPECKDVDFTYENGVLSFTVDKFTTHGVAVIDI